MGFIASIRNTRINLLIFGILLFSIITIHNSSLWGASLSWMLPACFFIVVGNFIPKYKRVKSTPFALICYWLVIFISTVFSSVVPLEQNVFSFAILLLCFYIVSTVAFDENQIKLILLVYIISALVCSLFVIKNWLAGDFFNAWTLRASYRFLGEYKDPNYVAAYICPAAFFLFVSVTCSAGKKKILSLLGLLIFIITILCIGSRGAMLTIAVAIAYYFLMSSSISKTNKIIIFSVGFLIVLMIYRVYVSVMPQQVFDRLENSSDNSRLDLWAAGMKGFTNNPIIGCGLGSSNAYSNALAGNHCHNVYIDALSACGILGNLFFIYVFVQNCMRSSKHNRTFIHSSILVFFIPLVFINGFNSATFITPLIMMTILSNYCRHKELSFQRLLS